MLDHAVATYALVDGYLHDQSGEYLAAAQAAVRVLVTVESPYLAWRRGARDGSLTVRTTAFAVAALELAELADRAEWAEFFVPDECWQGTLSWLDHGARSSRISGSPEERAFCEIVCRSNLALESGALVDRRERFLVSLPELPLDSEALDAEGLTRLVFGVMAANRMTTGVRAEWDSFSERRLLDSVTQGHWSTFNVECQRDEPVLASALALVALESSDRLAPMTHRWLKER